MDTSPSDLQKQETVRRILARPTNFREMVAKRIKDGKLPPSMLGGLSEADRSTIGDDADRLESAVEIDRLEAIVRMVGRPPLIVRNGQVQIESGDLFDFEAGTDALVKGVQSNVLSVGRVEFMNFDMSWGGTGWVVKGDGDTRMVVTNRHVAKLVARRAFDGRGLLMRDPMTGVRYAMSIDFNEEVGAQPGDAKSVDVTAIDYLADDAAADVALLTITGDGLPTTLTLSESEAEQDERVALIGYPAHDPRNKESVQQSYFKDLFDIKRFAPGLIMQTIGANSLLMHDCTSLGGNSGSPLIRLEDGTVVGLHFSGLFGTGNSAVGVTTLRDLVDGKRPVAVAVAIEGHQEAAADGFHAAAHFADRKGYDPAFLGNGLGAPWPTLSAPVQAGLAPATDGPPDRPSELRYTHFSVQYSATRRQPALTAVNIDGAHSVHIKRGRDKWFQDGRIDRALQLTKEDYDDEEIDRGHMVRREDPNWDPAIVPGPDVTSELAVLADGDTFHYTNAALQHSRLNQGKQLWQGLENFILDNARTHGFRACVFTGPVFRDDEDLDVKDGLLAPLEYWKLVAMVDADKQSLHATAYLLSQGQLIRELLEKRSKVEGVEGFALGAYRTFQIAIRDLAEATGYDLSPYIAADPLGKTDANEAATASGEPLYVPLGSFDDIVT
jgi:endonuclease G, mitochondrial